MIPLLNSGFTSLKSQTSSCIISVSPAFAIFFLHLLTISAEISLAFMIAADLMIPSSAFFLILKNNSLSNSFHRMKANFFLNLPGGYYMPSKLLLSK